MFTTQHSYRPSVHGHVVRSRVAASRLATVLALTVAFLAAGVHAQPGGANPGSLSQFAAGKSTLHYISAFNPTPREQFVLMIYYDINGDLFKEAADTISPEPIGANGGCTGVVLPPHGSDDEVISDAEHPYRDLGDVNDDSGNYEAIFVPTQGTFRGRFDREGKLPFGGYIRTRWGFGNPLPPRLFSLPTGANLTDLTTCACAELTAWSLPSDLLSEVGITCPP